MESGTRLGPYEVQEQLGAGGMGEVYLAQDTRLGRKVAIKVLPAEFAGDAERLARFEQEARAAAALNHPHIAVLHDIGSHQGDDGESIHFMVQEYLEGQPLDGVLESGPLTLKKALTLGTEITEALAAAHTAGIVHRDLKPANIFVTAEGHAKLLDFGLAKLTEAAPAGTSASMSPTMLGTVVGQVMGTAGYMAPEQVNGEPVDHRADLFAFGCVLYEMVTGDRAFAGDNVHETLSRILSHEPQPLAYTDATLPAKLQWITGKLLAKDRDERYQAALDLTVDLRGLRNEVEAGKDEAFAGEPIGETVRVSTRTGIPVTLAIPLLVLAIVAASAAGWWLARPGTESLPQRRFSIVLPEGTSLPTGSGRALDVSADGRTLVFVAEGPGGKQLYVRRMDELETTLVPGTTDVWRPVISPDGKWVAFGSSGEQEMSKVNLDTFEIYPLCDGCWQGSWGDDGNLVVVKGRSLWRIPETGGEGELLIEPSADNGVRSFGRPHVLPGSRGVLFGDVEGLYGALGALSPDSGEIVWITDAGSSPMYVATGHILYARGNILFATPFDVDSMSITGPEAHVLQGVRVENAGALQTTISGDGLLVYAPAGAALGTQLAWVDRDGTVDLVSDERRAFTSPRVSPTGERIAVEASNGGKTDIWIIDVGSGAMWPLTSSGAAFDPVWTRDGLRVAYAGRSAGEYTVKWVVADGSGESETLFVSDFPVWPDSWHPDGNRLVFGENSTTRDLFVWNVTEKSRTELAASPSADEDAAALSPDGDLVAFVSDKGGGGDVYLRPFPAGPEVVVSVDGGTSPVWNDDATELFYRDRADAHLRVASLQGTRVTDWREILEVSNYWNTGGRAHFDVHPGDDRFLFLKKSEGEETPMLHVAINWFDELNRLAPTDR